MDKPKNDVDFSATQREALSQSIKGLSENTKAFADNKLSRQEATLSYLWLMYLSPIMEEAVYVAKGQKRRTTTKRRTALKKLQALIGRWPSEDDVRSALSKAGGADESLVKAITDDVKRLAEPPTSKPRRTGIDAMEAKLKKLLKK